MVVVEVVDVVDVVVVVLGMVVGIVVLCDDTAVNDAVSVEFPVKVIVVFCEVDDATVTPLVTDHDEKVYPDGATAYAV